MNLFDEMINKVVSPSSVPAGVGTVLLTLFSSKIGPKVPDHYLKLLDNILVKIILVAFLINQQIRSPTNAMLLATGLVGGLTVMMKLVAPDSHSVSDLVRPAVSSSNGDGESKDKPSDPKTCNCYCNSTIYPNPYPQNENARQAPAFQNPNPTPHAEKLIPVW
ncbi:hypothetical protein HDV00_012587 [Rhizophlyctis rosea]|nr:hypothetical protein HDV00_012587 [Rhizophlyctis rosea]